MRPNRFSSDISTLYSWLDYYEHQELSGCIWFDDIGENSTTALGLWEAILKGVICRELITARIRCIIITFISGLSNGQNFLHDLIYWSQQKLNIGLSTPFLGIWALALLDTGPMQLPKAREDLLLKSRSPRGVIGFGFVNRMLEVRVLLFSNPHPYDHNQAICCSSLYIIQASSTKIWQTPRRHRQESIPLAFPPLSTIPKYHEVCSRSSSKSLPKTRLCIH